MRKSLNNLTPQIIKKFSDFYKKSRLPFLYSTFVGVNLFPGEEELFYRFLGNNLVVVSESRTGGERKLLPYIIDGSREEILIIKDYMIENEISAVECIPEDQVKFFQDEFVVKENEEWTFEVVYPVERFKNFVGIEKNRRLSKKFQSTNSFEFVEYDESRRQDVLNLLLTWRSQTAHPDNDKSEEYGLNYLFSTKASSVVGFVLTIDGRTVGYSFGEVQNNNTFGFFFVKGDHQYQGIYQALQTLTVNHPKLAGVEFFNYGNLTQVEALQKSKLLMKPEKIIKNWVARI